MEYESLTVFVVTPPPRANPLHAALYKNFRSVASNFPVTSSSSRFSLLLFFLSSVYPHFLFLSTYLFLSSSLSLPLFILAFLPSSPVHSRTSRSCFFFLSLFLSTFHLHLQVYLFFLFTSSLPYSVHLLHLLFCLFPLSSLLYSFLFPSSSILTSFISIIFLSSLPFLYPNRLPPVILFVLLFTLFLFLISFIFLFLFSFPFFLRLLLFSLFYYFLSYFISHFLLPFTLFPSSNLIFFRLSIFFSFLISSPSLSFFPSLSYLYTYRPFILSFVPFLPFFSFFLFLFPPVFIILLLSPFFISILYPYFIHYRPSFVFYLPSPITLSFLSFISIFLSLSTFPPFTPLSPLPPPSSNILKLLQSPCLSRAV